MNEFKKYIVEFDLLTFLKFNKSFIAKFYKFTNLITSLIKIMCIILLIVVFIRDLLVFIDQDYFQLFKKFDYFCFYINLILIQFLYLSMMLLLFKMRIGNAILKVNKKITEKSNITRYSLIKEE